MNISEGAIRSDNVCTKWWEKVLKDETREAEAMR